MPRLQITLPPPTWETFRDEAVEERRTLHRHIEHVLEQLAKQRQRRKPRPHVQEVAHAQTA